LVIQRFHKQVERCEDIGLFLHNLKDFLSKREKSAHTYFDDVETDIEDKLNSLNEQIKIYDNLIENYNRLVEYKQVLIKSEPFLGG
jgi:hypothetical protein